MPDRPTAGDMRRDLAADLRHLNDPEVMHANAYAIAKAAIRRALAAERRVAQLDIMDCGHPACCMTSVPPDPTDLDGEDQRYCAWCSDKEEASHAYACLAEAVKEAEELEAEVTRLRAALHQCDVVMDTAATLGLPQELPPAYRDSWAAAHLAARKALTGKEG